MPSQDLLSKARNAYEAFNRRDFDVFLPHFSDRFEYLDVAMDHRVQGADGFKQYCQDLLTAYPDGKVEIKNMVAANDYIVTEYVFTGTHQGAMMSKALGRRIQPTHKCLALPVCEVTRYENGKVASIHAYSDAMTAIRQLGLESQLGQLAAA